METNHDRILCPANKCKQGSLLLGARIADGTVAIFPEPLAIDDEFINQAKSHAHTPEERFRFTNKCIEGSCRQWTGSGCGVVEHVVQFLDAVPAIDPHFPCSIRRDCRWFKQKQYEACKICPYILRDITGEEVERYFEEKYGPVQQGK